MHKKTLVILLTLISIFIFSGCQNIYLQATSPTSFTKNGIIYKVEPYTPELHQKLNIDPIFYELSLNTAFLITITNLSDIPVQTFLKETFVLKDIENKQYRTIKNPFMYVKDAIKTNQFSELSYIELKNTEMRTDLLLNQGLSTENIDYYQSELNDLKEKIYLIEQNQLFKEELLRREKVLENKLEIHAFKDQIIYSQGINQGLIIFPPINSESLSNSSLFFTCPGNEVITISFIIKTSN